MIAMLGYFSNSVLSTVSMPAWLGDLYMMFSTTHLPFSAFITKSMNLAAASGFLDALVITMVSTHRSEPSLGITYLISGLSVMP